MSKLIIKNFLTGFVFVGIGAAIASVLLALLGLFAKLLQIPFNAIWSYIWGGVIAAVSCFTIKRFFITQKGYFRAEEIDDSQKKLFWINNIRSKTFIKKGAVQATYVPSLLLGVAIIVLACVLYSTLQNAGEASSYIGFTAICAIIGASAVAFVLYGILGIISIDACEKCGAVNAFIYDGDLEFNIISHYRGQETAHSSGVNAYGKVWGGGGAGFDSRKLKKYGNRIARHCACCGEKSTYTEVRDQSSILQ